MNNVISANGRWGGQVTAKPLPESSDELQDLKPELRAQLAQTWWMQSATEARVAHSFAIVHTALQNLRAGDSLVVLSRRAIDDEHRHAVLCRTMANRTAGKVTPEVPALPMVSPTHPHAKTEEERCMLFVVGQCALNETFANAYLSEAYRGAKGPLARAALSELLRDEIDHARIGWAFISTLSPALRTRLSAWLAPLTAANLRQWLAATQYCNHNLEAHGVPHADAVREQLFEVVREVLVPGFLHMKLDTRALERWVTQGMPI